MTSSDAQVGTVPTSEPVDRDAIGRDLTGLLIVLAAFAFILVFTLKSDPLQSANDRSRWCTIWSLVERGTYQIDEIDQDRRWSTIDKVRHRNGEDEPYHFYSSKPPLFPTMVAGLYWVVRNTFGYDLIQHTTAVTRLLLVLVNVIPMLLALLSLRKSLGLLPISRQAVWWLLLIAGFASMLNPFLTTLNNHTPAAICLMFCLSAMIRIHANTGQPLDFAIVGGTAALTCCFELPAALFGVLSFLFVVTKDWRKTAFCYVPAAIVPLAAFFVTNVIVTGGIKPFYAYYGTDKYEYVHEGIPSYWMNPQGIDANKESTPTYLFHCLLGHHGLLSITPVFLLSLWGWCCCRSGDSVRAIRPVLWMGCGLSLAILVFYLTRTQNYNYGGNSSALRWMLWLTPFWWYGMVPAVDKLARSIKGTLLLVLLIVPSFYSVAWSISQPWRPGWIYDRMDQAGIINYRTIIPPFAPQRFGVINALPRQPGVRCQWYGTDDASGYTLTVHSKGHVMVGRESGRILTVQKRKGNNSKGSAAQSAVLVVLYDRFEKGGDVRSWSAAAPTPFSIPEEDTTPPPSLKLSDLKSPPTWVVESLRGLPSVRSFNAESPRYLSYQTASGEKTAIFCERGAARIKAENPEHGNCWYRCDVLYSDELPFGVAQWRITVSKADSGQTVRTELWTCRDLPGKSTPAGNE